MRRLVTAALAVAALALVASPGPTSAQTYQSYSPWGYNIKVGYADPINEELPSGSIGFSFAGFYQPPTKPALGIGFETGFNNLGSKSFGYQYGDIGISNGQLTFQLRLRGQGPKVRPYIEGGAGAYTFYADNYPDYYYANWETFFGANGGAGIQIGPGPIRFDASVKYHVAFASNEDPQILTIMGGISFN